MWLASGINNLTQETLFSYYCFVMFVYMSVMQWGGLNECVRAKDSQKAI